MSALKLITYPHKNLKQLAKSVTEFNDDLILLAQRLFDVMYAHHHWGLAAPEVGIPLKVIVTTGLLADKPLCLINPEIIEAKEDIVCEEKSLVFPGTSFYVKRKKELTVQYQDLDNKSQTISLKETVAGMLQQKLDLLNGILIIDHLSKLKRERFLVKYKKSQACGHGCEHEHH